MESEWTAQEIADARRTIVDSLRSSKSWTRDYAEAFVDRLCARQASAELLELTARDYGCPAHVIHPARSTSGPYNPPVWCCLEKGHEGPHRHNGGGMYPSIPFLETAVVSMIPTSAPTMSEFVRMPVDQREVIGQRVAERVDEMQASAEPVGHVRGMMMHQRCQCAAIEFTGESVPYGTALYTHPPAQPAGVSDTPRTDDLQYERQSAPLTGVLSDWYSDMRDLAVELEHENTRLRAAIEAADKLREGPALDIDAMVSRFLGWRLPDDFAPDAGITFTPHPDPICWPIGTNILTATQARAMLEYACVIGDTVQPPSEQPE